MDSCGSESELSIKESHESLRNASWAFYGDDIFSQHTINMYSTTYSFIENRVIDLHLPFGNASWYNILCLE